MRVMELHSPVKMIQRSKGQSATAAAAYRSGTRLECERTGEVHDYTRKKGIENTALLFPMDTPERIQDRQTLWNSAEMKENRKNSQTARDLEVSFPAEFSFEQRREAGLTIGHLLVDRYGVAADVCWHQPSKKGDRRNFHLHALFTTRKFENGEWSKTKDRTFDDIQKGKEEILNLRQGIADVLNNIAARDGLAVYVEHLSFEKRGIDKEATQHLGHSATELERKGIKTEIGNHNREIQKRNEERQKLYEEQKAVNMEIKTAVSYETPNQPVQTPSATPKFSPQTRESDFYKAFYQETQKRRLDLLQSLKGQYGEQERASKQELTQIFNSVSQARGIFGFWRNITGRTKKDQEQISQLQANLQEIEQQRQEAFAAFEKERQSQLENLKNQEWKKQTEQVPANENNRLAELKSVSEEIKMRQKNQSLNREIEYDWD